MPHPARARLPPHLPGPTRASPERLPPAQMRPPPCRSTLLKEERRCTEARGGAGEVTRSAQRCLIGFVVGVLALGAVVGGGPYGTGPAPTRYPGGLGPT